MGRLESFFLSLLLAWTVWAAQGGDGIPSFTPAPTATAVTYVYEKDNGKVPPAVVSALNELNRGGALDASIFEEDTRDGDGDVPDQYKAPLAAATEAGSAALVVTAGDKVLKVVKVEKDMTVEQILEAVK